MSEPQTDSKGWAVQDEANPAEIHTWKPVPGGFRVVAMRPKRVTVPAGWGSVGGSAPGDAETVERWEWHPHHELPARLNARELMNHFGLGGGPNETTEQFNDAVDKLKRRHFDNHDGRGLYDDELHVLGMHAQEDPLHGDQTHPEDFYAAARGGTPARLAREPADQDEASFREQMRADPRDATVRGVYADWLDEHDRPEEARRLRLFAALLPHLNRPHPTGRVATVGAANKLPQWLKRMVVQHGWRINAAPYSNDANVRDDWHAAHDREWPATEVRALTDEPDPEGEADALRYHYTTDQFLDRAHDHRGEDELTSDPLSKAVHALKSGAVKLARMKVPAGGQITGGGTQTGGTFQTGGQFAARARRRIRETVMAWLQKRGATQDTPERLARKAAKPTAGDLTQADLDVKKPAANVEPAKTLPLLPAADTAIHAAKDRAASEASGGDPDIVAGPNELRKPLTIRELKDVEQSLRLPAKLHLSKLEANKDKTDADTTAPLTLDEYYKWANHVARHVQRQGLSDTAAERLRDPKHLSRAKLAFLTSRMAREAEQAKSAFADTGGAASWYGDHVGIMTRHLHDEFHNGKPEDDELWGKLDPHTGRVSGGAAITLSKLLVAATSGGMKPHENYDTAHAMIEAGRKHGAGSENPFKSIPENQADDFKAWVDAVEAWHAKQKDGVTREEILNPGRSLRVRTKWFERVMRPMRQDEEGRRLNSGNGGTNNSARYSGIVARYVGDATSPHYAEPIAVSKQSVWRSPYVSTVAEPRHRTLSAADAARETAPADEPDYTARLYDAHPTKGQIVTQKLPAVDAEGRLQPPGWTARNDQVLDGRDKINGVVHYFTEQAGGDERAGMKAAAHFFLTSQPQSEFDKIIKWTEGRNPALAKRLEQSSRENRGFYFSGEPLPGAFLLGPKFGAFSLNLHQDQPEHAHLGEHLTADLWWSRDWNVMLGTLFGAGEKDGPDRQETPRGTGRSSSHPERKLMRKTAHLAAQRAGLDNVAQLQAVLWYYEQQKPAWFGVDTSSTSYKDGANLVAKRKGKRYDVDPKTGHIHVEDLPRPADGNPGA